MTEIENLFTSDDERCYRGEYRDLQVSEKIEKKQIFTIYIQ